MYDAGDPSKDTEQDIDQQVGVAASLQEDGDWREEDRKEVEKDIALRRGCVSKLDRRVSGTASGN